MSKSSLFTIIRRKRGNSLQLRKVKLIGRNHSKWILLPSTRVLKRRVGRNHQGCITSWHRKIGHKRFYRPLLWTIPKNSSKNFLGNWAVCKGISYDPNRNAHIAILQPLDVSGKPLFKGNHPSSLFWTLAPEKIQINSLIYFGYVSNNSQFYQSQEQIVKYLIRQKVYVPNTFTRQPLRSFILSQQVHRISLNFSPNAKPKFCTAAGTFARILSYNSEYNLITLKLPSGKVLQISGNFFATSGIVSNSFYKTKKLAKAGQNSWRGWRPHVRGAAINPVDHPHGGRTTGGRPSVTPWGKLTKGFKTVKRTKNPYFV